MLKFVKNYKENLLLMLGHFATDICQGSISAALTVMYAHGVLHSNVELSVLVLASTLVSSIVQPLVGWISDKKPRPYLMGLGMIIAALGIMFIGFFDNYPLLFGLIACSGIGVAIFHPQAGKMANCVSVTHKGLGMSIFSVGGNLGFAAGPALISGSTLVFGLPGIAAVGVPAIIMLIVFTLRNQKYIEYSKREIIRHNANKAEEQENVLAFVKLTFMIFFRSCVLFGLTTFIPLYFMDHFGLSEQSANLNLTIIAFCAAVASMLGGICADKIGFKNVLAISATAATPFMMLFCLCDNNVLATILLIPVALSIYGTLSVSMVLGQKFLCNHVGFASGVTIGLGITFGGLFSPVLGYIGDTYGRDYIMWTIAGLMVITAILAWVVPSELKPTIAIKKLTKVF